MGKIVPVVVALVALAGGAGAGFVLRPAPPPDVDGGSAPAPEAAAEEPSGPENVFTLRDGFVVPVLRDGKVWSYVVLTLGVGTQGWTAEDVLLREPLLRDGLMEALFLHGSLGGFDEDFTKPQAMARLRRRLDEMVARRLDDPTARVLIVSMARQAA